MLGVVYAHRKMRDGGDLYLTRFGQQVHKHLDTRNWYEKSWFERYREKLLGTSSVYRVPTRKLAGESLDLVVKNCRVGEDIPFNTHTLEEFMSAEFNSPWEEFALTFEMREGTYGPAEFKIRTQEPLAIYIPPETMQLWQSGRSRSKINRIRARHPGIDLDILKQYKLIYGWIKGQNLVEVFQRIDLPYEHVTEHLKALDARAMQDLVLKGYFVADMKPEHVIIAEEDVELIEATGRAGGPEAAARQVELLYRLVEGHRYSIIDYELLYRTPEHDDAVKSARRHSYLDDQRDRFRPTPMPEHLGAMDVFGVPYVHGHTESTGGHLWVVGRNARLFDYFLPERWRKTPALSLSKTNEVMYTVTKDNIHLVWKTSRVGEVPEDAKFTPEERQKAVAGGVNSPFEEFAIAQDLNRLGIHTVYMRAIYMTGSAKIETSADRSRFDSHADIAMPDGGPLLSDAFNYITIRGFYNGSDDWVPEHEDALFTPINLSRAVADGVLGEGRAAGLLQRTRERLDQVGYDGTLLELKDLLLAIDGGGAIVLADDGEPDVIICDLEFVWKKSGSR